MADRLVWYAAYGSNVDRDRFLAYLVGGRARDVAGTHTGSRDPRPPRQDRPHRFDRGIRFGGRSRRWSGATAYLDHSVERDSRPAMGRCYLITFDQFLDVFGQENGAAAARIELESMVPGRVRPVHDGAYGAVLPLADMEGFPVLTFTSPRPPSRTRTAAPSAAYLRTMLGGIVASHRASPGAVADHLAATPGVAPTWTSDQIAALLE